MATAIHEGMAPLAAETSDVIGTLEDLVAAGYVENQQAICRNLARFADRALAVRMLLVGLSRGSVEFELSGAQSFIVYRSKIMAMRVNAWVPRLKLHEAAFADLDRYFSIGVCHNHNFDFFTTCVFGPGYTSEFKQTSIDTDPLEQNDVVRFDRTWVDRLGLGDSLFIPRETVFHTQEMPEAFSLTLNLIPLNGYSKSGRQYTLADDRETVKRVIVAN